MNRDEPGRPRRGREEADRDRVPRAACPENFSYLPYVFFAWESGHVARESDPGIPAKGGMCQVRSTYVSRQIRWQPTGDVH